MSHFADQWQPQPASGRDDFLSQCRTALEEGKLSPGERLPNERYLAEATGISRSTVRAALKILEREEEIVRHVGRGTFVAEKTPLSPTPANESAAPRNWSISQLMEFRLFVEPALADLVVLSASESDFAELTRIVEEGRKVRAWQDAEVADRSFHSTFFRMSHNGIFVNVSRKIDEMRDSLSWMRLKESSFSPEKWNIYQSEHEQILSALVERNAEAARNAIRRHLAGVRAKAQLAQFDV